MSRKVKSARGEMVDFDLLQVKSKIQEADKPLDVKTREDFVHMKRKRRGSSKITEMIRKESEHAEIERQKTLEQNREKSKKVVEDQKIAASKDSDVNKTKKKTSSKKSGKKGGRKIVKKDSNE